MDSGWKLEIIRSIRGSSIAYRASAEDVRARLTDPPTYSTVRVMLVRLEKKGYVHHTPQGVRYVYSATIPPHVAKRSALRQYVQTCFAGSLAQMVTTLLRQGSWTEEELEGLKAEIERAREKNR